MMPTQSYFRIWSLLVILSFTFIAQAQNLVTSRKTSYNTYIYKIQDKEAKKINKKESMVIDSTYFHTLIDMYPTDSTYNKKLPAGHYIKTYTEGNKLMAMYTFVPDFDVMILNNNTDLYIQIYDLKGNIISDADVKIKSKKLRYDKKTKCYIKKKSNKKGLLTVSHNDNTAYYNVTRSYNNSALLRGTRTVVYSTPIKYAWIPVNYIVRLPIDGVKSIAKGYPDGVVHTTKWHLQNFWNKMDCVFDGDGDCFRREKNYKGYFVFNKPKYAPNDTVKFKTFIVDNKGKPIDETVKVVLYNDRKSIKLTDLVPYRKGAYEYQFFLHDSLGLKLDKSYSISLQKKNRHRVYKSGYFKYEDYELSKIKLDVRSDVEHHYYRTPLKVYAKGTDENNLNLQDARVELYAKPTNVNKYFDQYTFIPDTLFFFEKELRPRGETEIEIPDSLFPKANFDYEIEYRMLTSDNQRFTTKKNYRYFYSDKEFDISLVNDSIQFVYKENGIKKQEEVSVYATDNFGNKTNLQTDALTPCTIELNPYYSSYTIEGSGIKESINIASESSLLTCFSQRTNDSVFVEIKNPRNLHFTYNIYKKNTEKLRGSGETLEYKESAQTKQNYFVSIRYLWGGKIKEDTYRIPLLDKQLNITVKQPPVIYPGQKVNMEILITDSKGKPVENVDLTAYSITKKFDYTTPNVPYLGKGKPNKKVINNFTFESQKNDLITPKLNYEYWNELANLDSIEYYKFLYPKNSVYKYAYKSQNKQTQFAPFVVSSQGEIKPIHIIYIDHRPVYFSWSTTLQPYSFNITPGKHQIKLRTEDRLITLENVNFNENEKLIFSLCEDIQGKNISVNKMTSKLTDYEKNHIEKYMYSYRNSFKNKYAYIQNGTNIQLMNPSYNRNSLINWGGPINGVVDFNVLGEFNLNFEHEPYFEYEFRPNQIKMREIDKKIYPSYLYSYNKTIPSFRDEVLTLSTIEDEWNSFQDTLRRSNGRYRYPVKTNSGYGTLEINYNLDKNKKIIHPLNQLLFRYDTPEFIRVYQGNVNKMHELREGIYQLVSFFPGDKYIITDSIQVKSNGKNHSKLNTPTDFKKDSFSIRVSNLIKENLFIPVNTNLKENHELESIYRSYQQQFAYTGVGETVSGIVIEKSSKEPLIGVRISIKGTNYGTISDYDGRFTIKVPYSKNELLVSYIGYQTKILDLGIAQSTVVELEEDYQSLDELVVIGYGTQKKMSMTGAITTVSGNSLLGGYAGISGNVSQALQGRVAGISVGTSGAATSIRIRGTASVDFAEAPLFVIDGMVYTGDASKLDITQFADISILKDASATAIYGARAANGVILISTKEGNFKDTITEESNGNDTDDTFMDLASQSSSIRNNFSDYAYWQPRLTTDKHGKASFDVTFPDDVTSWNTYVLAMNDKRQTGQTQGNIRSFKPLMAQLAVPNFLLEEDKANIIGKTLNYTSDTITVNTLFEINKQNVLQKRVACLNSHLDTLQVTGTKDTVTVCYSMKKDDGYFDGEERKIPVFPIGLEETKGDFLILEKNTNITKQFDPTLGKVYIYAKADYLEVMNTEIKRLINYRYECNEQLASRLKALLAEKTIVEYQGGKWKRDRDVEKIIKQLDQRRNGSGFWGWWQNSETDYTFSYHILNALIGAKQQGYKVNLDEGLITDKLIFELDKNQSVSNKINLLRMLRSLNSPVDYTHYIKNINKNKELSLSDFLKLTELKQELSITVNLDTLNTFKKETLFGNVYYQNSKETYSPYHLENNNIQNTLSVYRILKKQDDKAHEVLLSKIRFYLLEEKKVSGWRNTYETAQIIETILPDILQDKKKAERAKLTISGDIEQTITKFPLDTTFNAVKGITFRKTGDDPIYLTVYQREWNKNPSEKQGDFVIKTHFKDNENNTLEAGKPIKMVTKLEVKKDADHVMLNIPIPAGCSYGKKEQRFRNEIHREYFKHETAIFCQKLKAGSYEFEIELIPRYTGTYNLNPAKAELMYFPTFNANTELKKVEIK